MNKKTLYVFYFVSIIIIGSIGFYVIGGEDWSYIDSIYMTIITLTFVGFSEVHPLNDFGRIWAIIVIGDKGKLDKFSKSQLLNNRT